MKSAMLALVGGVTFMLGVASLALTAWLWLGDWPQETMARTKPPWASAMMRTT